MAASRRNVVFFCLGTLVVLLLFFVYAAEASVEESEFSEIHAVKHEGSCSGGLDSEKGEQCQDEDDNHGDDDDDDDLDDDVDDTYKIVNKVKVSLSHSTKIVPPEGFDVDGEDGGSGGDDKSDSDAEFDVLGH